MAHRTMSRTPIRVKMFGAGAMIAALLLAAWAVARAPANHLEEKKSMNEASGEFDIRVVPADTGDAKIGLMTFEKRYRGDLDATATGRMLTAATEVKPSRAYVALEEVKGSLKGVEGAFLLYHTGVMTSQGQSLDIRVVPDSGTGGLTGIQGELHITITGGKHFYRFAYTLPNIK